MVAAIKAGPRTSLSKRTDASTRPQNDAVMTTASSILKAFDRLEVAEFSARSLLDTALIGSHVPIGETEIADLKRAFKLAEED